MQKVQYFDQAARGTMKATTGRGRATGDLMPTPLYRVPPTNAMGAWPPLILGCDDGHIFIDIQLI